MERKLREIYGSVDSNQERRFCFNSAAGYSPSCIFAPRFAGPKTLERDEIWVRGSQKEDETEIHYPISFGKPKHVTPKRAGPRGGKTMLKVGVWALANLLRSRKSFYCACEATRIVPYIRLSHTVPIWESIRFTKPAHEFSRLIRAASRVDWRLDLAPTQL